MEQLTVQSLGFPIGFQEDIKIIIIIITIIITITITVIIVIVIVILACPDARCESGQTSGSCRNIIMKIMVVLDLDFSLVQRI